MERISLCQLFCALEEKDWYHREIRLHWRQQGLGGAWARPGQPLFRAVLVPRNAYFVSKGHVLSLSTRALQAAGPAWRGDERQEEITQTQTQTPQARLPATA